MFETIGLLAVLVGFSVAGGFCFGLGFWLSKRVVAKLRIKIDLQRKPGENH